MRTVRQASMQSGNGQAASPAVAARKRFSILQPNSRSPPGKRDRKLSHLQTMVVADPSEQLRDIKNAIQGEVMVGEVQMQTRNAN